MTNLSDIIKGPNLEPEFHDRSELEDFATCPLCASKVKSGEVKDGGELAESGQACHEIIADPLKSGMSYADLIEEIPDMARAVRPDIQPRVISSLKGISKAMRFYDPDKIIGVEKQLSAELMPATSKRGPVIVTACLDLLVGSKQPATVICTDFKTGWKHRNNTEAYEAYQTQHNSWLIWKNYETVDYIHWFYAQTVDGKNAYCLLERERDYFNFMGRIQTALDKAMSGSTEAWPGDKCRYCPATHVCPEVTEGPRAISSDPSAFFGQYIALQGRLGVMKKTMNGYCKVGERSIELDGHSYGYEIPDRKVEFKWHKPKKPKPTKVKKESKK